MAARVYSALCLTLAMGLASAADARAVAESPRNPAGEQAAFAIVADGVRTTGAVNEGTFATTVVQGARPGTFGVRIAYDVDIAIVGRRSGSRVIEAPAEFFAPDFVVKLRETKHFVSPGFKVEYLGREDVITADGKSYRGADLIRLYDIRVNDSVQASRQDEAESATVDSTGNDLSTTLTFEIGAIRAAVMPGVPALGAVQIDLTGTLAGLELSIGADLRPASAEAQSRLSVPSFVKAPGLAVEVGNEFLLH